MGYCNEPSDRIYTEFDKCSGGSCKDCPCWVETPEPFQVVDITRTSYAAPSQWEGKAKQGDDELEFYIRWRYNHFNLRIMSTSSKGVRKIIGDGDENGVSVIQMTLPFEEDDIYMDEDRMKELVSPILKF